MTGLLPVAAALTFPADGAAGVPLGRAADRDGRGALERPSMTASTAFPAAWDIAHESNELREAVRLMPASSTPKGVDEGAVIKRLAAHLKRWDCAAALARSVECKPAVIDCLLRSPERIPVAQRATLLDRAESWMRADARRRALAQADVVPTAIVRSVVGIARLVANTRTVGLVSGPPGCGKSAAVGTVQAALSGVVSFCADCDGRGARGALRAVATASAGTMPLPPRVTVKSAMALLRETVKLVVVDEAQGISVAGLEALRAAVVDGAGCGLLLLGTTAMTRAVDDRADALLGPLVSRIGLRCDLGEQVVYARRDAGGWLAADELNTILTKRGIGAIEPAGARRLLGVANTARGLIRRACNAARVGACLAIRRGGGADAVISETDVVAAMRLGGLEAG